MLEPLLTRAVRWYLILWGITLIAFGVSHVLFGADSVFGGRANATVDSEMTFAGALLIGYGGAYLWALRHRPIPIGLLQTLAAITAVGSVGRLLSMLREGAPEWFYSFGTAAEFVTAALTWWIARLIPATSPQHLRAATRGHQDEPV